MLLGILVCSCTSTTRISVLSTINGLQHSGIIEFTDYEDALEEIRKICTNDFQVLEINTYNRQRPYYLEGFKRWFYEKETVCYLHFLCKHY